MRKLSSGSKFPLLPGEARVRAKSMRTTLTFNPLPPEAGEEEI
jgi:hypothetical protein